MTIALSDLRIAAFCPRKLYYRRQEADRSPPAHVQSIRDLAFQYPRLREADRETLAGLPIDVSPQTYRTRLDEVANRLDRWDDLANPGVRNLPLAGRECHGIVHKVLAGPPRPVVVSPGRPPDVGVWEPHSVQAVGATKALAWRCRQEIPVAYVEYPAHGVIRRVEMTTRRKAQFRETIRAVRSLDGPPARIQNSSKCESCDYVDSCGVRTRSLASLIGG